MSEPSEIPDGRSAAEDYRRQLQRAAALKSGMPAITRDEILRWVRANRPMVLEVAKRSGATESECEAVAEAFANAISQLPSVSELDDPHAILILDKLIERIEAACKKLNVPIGDGVAFGSLREPGLTAQQFAVLQTTASIIDVSIPFLVFCDLVSKAVSHTLDPRIVGDNGIKFSLDASAIREKLRSDSSVRAEWIRIVRQYAVTGKPPIGLGEAPEGPRAELRRSLLDAMEVFAVAHEYGHHSLQHGVGASSSNDIQTKTSAWEDEYQADIFARLISGALAETAADVMLLSGAGSIILAGTDLIARARQTLLAGTDVVPERDSHPPLAKRLERLDAEDRSGLPSKEAEWCVQFRRNVVTVIAVVWEELKPTFGRYHAEGLRPDEHTNTPANWLPLSPRH
ncbi:hypothetical protein [Bradyrhizobium sp. Bra64]|uniref:hypothetical protein n=1 Tax=Bradyrhizobium sp. Bra64 TaxID=2926009 RepID=UPI002117780E|nr:hypothetical protein [Bradyrhizobium sp. Bra64]